jgi:cobalt-precorrin 5A hydrolase/precorrin-3B C17-methyltransferase
MRILVVAAGARARQLALGLPWPVAEGDPRQAVEAAWGHVDALVCVMATPAALRLVAPLVQGKERDPAVVALDSAGRFAVALAGAHSGANELAEEEKKEMNNNHIIIR